MFVDVTVAICSGVKFISTSEKIAFKIPFVSLCENKCPTSVGERPVSVFPLMSI